MSKEYMKEKDLVAQFHKLNTEKLTELKIIRDEAVLETKQLLPEKIKKLIKLKQETDLKVRKGSYSPEEFAEV